ncbi:MAG TPA: DUF4430 domain-containing protein [Solirubrobacterales bacterium]|nr:DUF4430 domain-containing protein [Solirubrobacterales bacterium]
MRGRRGTAVASALLALLAAAGCGLGPGADVGDVRLTVTREFGAAPMLESSVAAKESDTVMRVLEREAEIETRYGGGFVHAIEGFAEEQRDGDPYDWFFFVDGSESPIGAAEVPVQGGERVWWDYRDWAAVYHVPAVVGSWPAPFVDGIGGKRYPVAVECREAGAACGVAWAALEREGVKIAADAPKDAIRVLVGPWQRLRNDPAAKLIEAGPGESGVFADFQVGVRPFRGIDHERTNAAAYGLVALDEQGDAAVNLGPGAGLVAATSRYGGPPVWVVTGGTEEAVGTAAAALGAEQLRDHYAVAIEDGEVVPLPLGER